MTYDDTVVAIFCKSPIPGEVKTRLAASIGPEAATAIYRASAEHVIWNVRHGGLPTVVFIDREDALKAFHDWVGGQLAVQEGKDLGERMKNASDVLVRHGYQQMIIVGTDTPWIDADTIHQAVDILHKNDIVIGPALDGGYYLIGTKGHQPTLFEEISWSTTEVLQQTQERAFEEGLSVGLLDELRDIDTWDDLKAILDDSPAGHQDFVRRCHLILRHTITG